ncbi:MAG: hypothetical protein IKW49_08715 [Opitutales bacterium]|nr:hypothetical protein [Opitutales bacterium]
MFYKLTKNENGNVKDKNGVRYRLAECVAAHTPQGLNVGYTEFPSRQAALSFYGVSDIPEDELFPQEEGAE